MIDVVKSASRSVFVRVTANRLTVEHVLAFADRLREEGIPLSEMVTDSHSWETRHLTGLSVRYSMPAETEGRDTTGGAA